MVKNNIIKMLVNITVFLIFILITFLIIFKNVNLSNIFNVLENLDKKYILLAIGAMVLFVCSEAINIKRTMKSLGNNVSFISSIKYACVGFFFSSVTPSSSGGDPAQLYFMKKDNLSLTHSALALLIEFSSFQFITIIIGIIGFFNVYNLLSEGIGNILVLFIVGIIINVVILFGLLTFVFSKRMSLFFINLFEKTLKLFRYKKLDELHEKMLKTLDEYHDAALYMKSNKFLLFKILVTSFVQVVMYHAIPYFVYLSFGLNEYSIITFVSIQAVLYLSVSSLPFPGAVGISEGSFMILFKMMFPVTLLSSAMLISRFISFYLFVILTGLFILISVIVKNRVENLKNV